MDERVVHAAVEAADVKVLVYERGPHDVVVAEVTRYNDGGFACCLRLLQCGEAQACERRFFCHACQVFWGEEPTDGSASDAAEEGVVLMGTLQTVHLISKDDFEPGGHLYCRQNEALVY